MWDFVKRLGEVQQDNINLMFSSAELAGYTVEDGDELCFTRSSIDAFWTHAYCHRGCGLFQSGSSCRCCSIFNNSRLSIIYLLTKSWFYFSTAAVCPSSWGRQPLLLIPDLQAVLFWWSMPPRLQTFMSALTQSDHVFLGLPRAFEHGTPYWWQTWYRMKIWRRAHTI